MFSVSPSALFSNALFVKKLSKVMFFENLSSRYLHRLHEWPVMSCFRQVLETKLFNILTLGQTKPVWETDAEWRTIG